MLKSSPAIRSDIQGKCDDSRRADLSSAEPPMPIRLLALLIQALFMTFALAVSPLMAAERVLTLSFGADEQRLTAEDLLARPDATSITIPDDVTYHRTMTYRAVPLLAIVGDVSKRGVATLEARASDGFVSQIPVSLVMKGETGGSVAWIAIEDPKAPWPNLAKRKTSAGPFYLVWQHPERSKVGSEEWPYALVALTGVDDPVSRWPQLAIDPSVVAGAAEHRGQAAFIKNCIPCHRLNGAGESNTGPDLGQPMNVTTYMTTPGIHALIRDPKSVRTWPDQRMPGFDAQKISDADIDAIIAFLAYTAKQ